MTVAGPPARLVSEAKAQLARARREWSPDAYPWRVTVSCGGNAEGLCETHITFESASKQIGLEASRFRGSDTFTYSQYAATSSSRAMSLDLLELDSALVLARGYGMRGRVDIARIEMHRLADGRYVPYWKIYPGDGSSTGNDEAFCLEGWSGKRVNCYRLRTR
jgi:hypothetical protein